MKKTLDSGTNQYCYETAKEKARGDFNMYQGKDGYIYMLLRNVSTKLSYQQIEDLCIDILGLKDFDMELFNLAYRNRFQKFTSIEVTKEIDKAIDGLNTGVRANCTSWQLRYYTIDELFFALPRSKELNGEHYSLEIIWRDAVNVWNVAYTHPHYRVNKHEEESPELVDALGKLLVWCIEEGWVR